MKNKIIKQIPIFLILILIVEIIATLTLPLWIQNVHMETTTFVNSILMLAGVIAAIIIYQSYKLSQIIKEKRFKSSYLGNLKIIIYMLMLELIILLTTYLIVQRITFLFLFIIDVLLICLLIALKEVYKSAIALQSDVDATI